MTMSIRYLAIGVICLMLIVPVMASTFSRESIAQRYGLNSIYLDNISYPGSHTIYNGVVYVALFPGVNETLIRESVKGVNQFYKFEFIDYRTCKYFINERGMIYSKDKNTLVVSMADNPCSGCGCGVTHGTSFIGVQIWIKNGDTPSVEYMTYLIQHELDHVYGLPCNPHPSENDMNYGNFTSENVTRKYTEESKSWGTVSINVIRGNDPEQWESWEVYI